MNIRFRFLNIIIILTMLLGFFVKPVAADEGGPGEVVVDAAESGVNGQDANYSRVLNGRSPSAAWTPTLLQAEEITLKDCSKGTGVYIVQLVDAPLALYTGGVPGLAATNPAAAGNKKLDANTPASLAYRAYLGTR